MCGLDGNSEKGNPEGSKLQEYLRKVNLENSLILINLLCISQTTLEGNRYNLGTRKRGRLRELASIILDFSKVTVLVVKPGNVLLPEKCIIGILANLGPYQYTKPNKND